MTPNNFTVKEEIEESNERCEYILVCEETGKRFPCSFKRGHYGLHSFEDSRNELKDDGFHKSKKDKIKEKVLEESVERIVKVINSWGYKLSKSQITELLAELNKVDLSKHYEKKIKDRIEELKKEKNEHIKKHKEHYRHFEKDCGFCHIINKGIKELEALLQAKVRLKIKKVKQ